MNTIFMNSENRKKSEPQKLHSILLIKETWEEKINRLLCQILVIIIHGKI